MDKQEIRQNAIEFLDKRTKQKDNLVISRNEAISGLCDFYETIQASTDQSKLLLADVISPLKTDLEKWIDGCEKAAGNLRDIGHAKDAQNFDGQAAAYWAVKNYLDVNGL